MTHPSTIAPPHVRKVRKERGGEPSLSRRLKGLGGAPAGRLRVTAIALGLFLATRIATLIVVIVTASAVGRSPFKLLGRSWDSVWYLGIAVHGYGWRTTHYRPGIIFSDYAFFPLYPGLVHAVSSVLPLSGGAAGLLISWTAAAAAAVGIFAVGTRLYGRGVGLTLVVLWGLLPHSVVLSMAYTEPVLTAFAAWSLYAVLSGRWIWAGTLATLAGISRPNGMAVFAAVVAGAAYEVWRVRRQGGHVPPRLWAGALLAPVGWCGYVAWVGYRRHDLLHGYFKVQSDWGSRFDFGAVSFVGRMLTHGERRFVFPMALLIVLVSVLLFGLLIADRAPLPLIVYSGVLLLVVVGGSGFFESKPRFLLPAFPLLLPVAQALARTARARPWHAVLVVGFLAGLSLSYGAYLIAFARAPL
ncbi:hypothetical protein ACIQNU_16320 [Streptomyces sp. NPDC091292]|uniref:hypothetical protein n=1 Tax=Streptomyces sp. NPDC091292 TaxID=3365991 RepID=UPI00382982F0